MRAQRAVWEEWPVGMCGHQPYAPRPQSREKAQVKRSATKEYNFVSVGGKIGALGDQSATWRNSSMNTVFLGK